MAASRNSRSSDSVLQAVSACISHHVAEGETVAVGYSGGLDSTVLLHAMCALSGSRNIEVGAIHVHHGLSPNADTWADHCAKTCGAMGIPLEVVRVDVKPLGGEGLEAAARRSRHRTIAAHPAQWKLLAHHLDDQAETILHNLLRGSGVRGAAAIPATRGTLLRPLLGTSRKALLDYAIAHETPWIDDESNADCRFTRNFIRTCVFPPLVARFPKGAEHLAAAANRFAEASSLLDDLAQLDLGGRPAAFPLPLSLLRDVSEIRARNLLRAMLHWQGAQSPDESRLNEFVRQIRSARSDRKPRLDLAAYSMWSEKGQLNFQARI
jgi:tRNA(Ile)-lysidine synthase